MRPAVSVALHGDESRRIIPAEKISDREFRFVLDAYCGWGLEAYILFAERLEPSDIPAQKAD